MTNKHLSLATLARLATGRIEVEEVQQVVIPHLIGVCSGCRQIHAELQQLRQEVGHWDDMVVVLEGQSAPELWRGLEALPYDEQLHQVEDCGELQTWGFCRLLLRKSLDAAIQRPEIAVRLAVLAVKIADRLADAYHRDWVADLRALACAHLGNARRVLSEIHSAGDAFRDAHAHLRRGGTGDPRIEAEVLSLEASLRRDERRFADALALLDRIIAIYTSHHPELRDLHLAGRALVNRAVTLEESGDVAAAILALRQAAPWIDEERDPRLILCLKHNLILYLPAVGLHQEAAALLAEVKELARRLGNEVDLIRLRWVEGRIVLGLGQRDPAEQAFREVQLEFLRRDLGYDAALASLDLGILYAQEGSLTELKRLALDILPVFSSRDIHRDAMAGLLLFQHACEEERLTVELARRLAAVLQRERPHQAAPPWQHGPSE